MTDITAAPIAVTETAPKHGRLASNALGLPSVLFCIVTGAAPLTAMLFNVPVAVQGGGYAAPAAFLVATVALTIFSVGYIAMSRRVTSAGGFYTFLTRGLGRIVGAGSGVLIALCYMVFAAAVVGVMGYFAATSVESWTGVALPAWLYMVVGLAVMTLLAWFHIELTSKVLGVLLVVHAARARARRCGDDRGLLPAGVQPRRALGRGERVVHRLPARDRGRDVPPRRGDRAGPAAAQPGEVRGARPLHAGRTGLSEDPWSVHSGLRFSRKAAIPSRAAGDCEAAAITSTAIA